MKSVCSNPIKWIQRLTGWGERIDNAIFRTWAGNELLHRFFSVPPALHWWCVLSLSDITVLSNSTFLRGILKKCKQLEDIRSHSLPFLPPVLNCRWAVKDSRGWHPRVATSDVPHFVSKITRHKTLLSHFFEAFSHCTLSLILGQSQPNFRLLSITLSYFAGTEAEILKWAFWRLQGPAVTFGETKSSVTGVPENRSICMYVCVREREREKYSVTAHLQHQSLPANCAVWCWYIQPY